MSLSLPAGAILRIEMTGLGGGRVQLSVQAVARVGERERKRDLASEEYDDLLDAERAARDWLSVRILAVAEAHAPEVPPVFDAPAQPAAAPDFDF